MKRGRNDDVWKGIKKLKSSLKITHVPFPEIKKPLLAIDFSKFIKGHMGEQDIIFTNGKVGFETHKKILMAISPFWKNVLEGDTSISILKIEEICDKTVELMQSTIEKDTKFNRNYAYYCIAWKITANKQILKDMIFLVGKHDCKILKELIDPEEFQDAYWLIEWFRRQKYPIAYLADLRDLAQKFNLSSLSGTIESHFAYDHFWSAAMEDFQHFPKEIFCTIVTKKIEKFMACTNEEFQQCLRYAIYQLKHSGDRSLIENIEGLEPPAKGWKNKIKFERKLKEAFHKVLLEIAT